MKKLTMAKRIGLVLFGTVVALIIIEGGLRTAGLIFLTLQEQENRESLERSDAYKVMCLGESTTAGQYPRLLEQELNERDAGIQFAVIDKGIPGSNSLSILHALENEFLESQPDMLVVMMGINDRNYGWKIRQYDTSLTGGLVSWFRRLRAVKLVANLIERVAPRRSRVELSPAEVADYDTCMELGAFAANQYDFPRAAMWYQRAGEISSGDAEALLGQGRAKLEQQHFEAAEMLLRMALEKGVAPERLQADIGRALAYQGKYRDAVEFLTRAVENHPDDDQAHLNLAIAYVKGQDSPRPEHPDQGLADLTRRQALELARPHLWKALELNPHCDAALTFLRESYSEIEGEAGIEAFVERARRMENQSEMLYGFLALHYKNQGRSDYAEQYFERASATRLKNYNPVTRQVFHRMREIVEERGMRLVCVEYPMRSVDALKRMFADPSGLIFVDNEQSFKDAVHRDGYDRYFVDNIGGVFGHCTMEGNALLARNIADAIVAALR